ncbi:MAG: hypothetical protein A2V77_20085 [Anaeromyxobacter sp. RBG_16_69_14]|nr:MAG: hypothetical protein A2V77_20085 [Anaeromyxobacter sp. RBG_16_69_14]
MAMIEQPKHYTTGQSPPRLRGLRWRAAPLLLGLLALSSACDKAEGAAAPERPPAPVAVATALERDAPVYLEDIGRATAREVVTVQPQVSGPITRIHFADGADVKRSDLLFTIDPRPYQAQLHSAEATLAQSRAVLGLARIEFARAEKLVESEAISRQDHASRRNAVAVAEAQVKSGQAAVETARLNVEHCSIRSPIDGRAGQRQVDLGNVVAPGSAGAGTPLLVIQRLDPIYADFTVPEKDLTAVQRAMAESALKVRVRMPDEQDERAREGELTFLDNAVQGGTGTVRLRATLSNGDRRFWPGRFVKVRLILGTQRNAVLVSANAPQVSAKGPFVYVVKKDSTAELRPVSLGLRQENLVAISQGLKPGEQVVTAGQLAVTPGGKVRVTEGAAGEKNSAATGGDHQGSKLGSVP